MNAIRLTLSIAPAPGEDEFALDDAVRRLRRELLDTDVDGVERLRGDGAAPGSKGAVEILQGVLAVALTADAGLVQSMVELVTAFAQRGPGRRVEVRCGDRELVIDGASRQDVRRVREAFLELVSADDERPDER
ncbi:hypothetical protein GCM10009678_24090 [Actinomadura kijaniata]|uniref:Uncharacterized protein n=1 Tax=Actinomadura namibiensis TaxID=182080 RepID=A0A7W3LP71_ACTNM|nr:hypothetical protein [Actinomadura namibiensis]MBA8951697.1 hypothetical protein [Actinomadura namibiensis]